jgi:hypothetical protein
MKKSVSPQRQYQINNLKDGRCPKCPRKVVPGYRMCREHLRKDAQRKTRRIPIIGEIS